MKTEGCDSCEGTIRVCKDPSGRNHWLKSRGKVQTNNRGEPSRHYAVSPGGMKNKFEREEEGLRGTKLGSKRSIEIWVGWR